MTLKAISLTIVFVLGGGRAHYHPGYPALHITRLHRYDHSGLAAMIEAEAKWHRGGAKAIPNPSTQQRKALRGHDQRTLLQVEEREESVPWPARRRFVQISSRQADALQQHHKARAALQLNASGDQSKQVNVNDNDNDNDKDAEVAAATRRHAAKRTWHGAPDQVAAVTGLSRLDSQYVGPIGVGTTVCPQGCSKSPGDSLVYMPPEAEGEGTSVFQAERRKCHVEDQVQIWVVMDTGSTNIWVASDLCTMGACAKKGRRRYNHSKSVSYMRTKAKMELNIQFGTGRIMGEQGIDDVHIGPFTVYNQTFGMIRVEEGNIFDEVPIEGILGLAWPKMSAGGVVPFFDNIIQQKVLGMNEFSFYFSLDNPAANALLWGGVDRAFYDGEIEYFKVVEPYYWSLKLLCFKIGEEKLGGNCKAAEPATPSFVEGDDSGEDGSKDSATEDLGMRVIVDTGTTYYTAERDLHDEIMSRIPPTECNKMTDASHPPITYTLETASGEARDFVLHSNQYMTSRGDNDPTCSPAFMQIDIPKEHGPAMLLGEVFLRHYFSTFDRSRSAVGFARAKHGEETHQYLRSQTKNQPQFAAAHPSSYPAAA